MTETPTRDEDTMSTDVPTGLIPADPDAAAPKAAKKAAKRPTTRAGRRAAAAAKAPSKDAAPKKTATAAPRKATLENRLAESLAGIGTYVSLAGMVAGPKVTVDGIIVVEHSATVAHALANVAAGNVRVTRALEAFLTASTLGELLGALLPVGLAIAANHEAVPVALVNQLGVKVPNLADYVPAAPSPAAGTEPGGSVHVA